MAVCPGKRFEIGVELAIDGPVGLVHLRNRVDGRAQYVYIHLGRSFWRRKQSGAVARRAEILESTACFLLTLKNSNEKGVQASYNTTTQDRLEVLVNE